MKTFTIIAGVNGVGKSGFLGARTNLEQDELRIDADKIAAEYNISNIGAGKIALKKINEAIKSGESFTQETTLSSHQIVKTIQKAKENGYFIILYYIGIDTLEDILSRIENRVKHGGHNIPKSDVVRRLHKQKEKLKEVIPLVNLTIFCDNSNIYNQFARYYKNGYLGGIKTENKWIKVYPNFGNLPKWFEALELNAKFDN